MKELIIGREAEQKLLQEAYDSNKSEFIAICGRRRVGKTFLVKEYFENELVFQTAGIHNGTMAQQIKSFYQELLNCGFETSQPPKDWLDIFFMLRKYLEGLENKRKVVLLDELPWMETPKSGFIAALEHFWNSWATGRHDIVLIVCGSATSWMMDKLINNHGGLHDRLTRDIFLPPFNLHDTRLFLERKGFHLSDYEVAECYMIMGGTPYYLDMLSPALSLSQNIDTLFFSRYGALRREFKNLYASLFRNSKDYITVVRALSSKRMGLTREEIIKTTGLTSGGGFSKILENLESCDFIRSYSGFDNPAGAVIYQLVDFYTFFYIRFVEEKKITSWSSLQGTGEFYAWAGLTFELLALVHVAQIKQKLGISGIRTSEQVWRCNDGNGKSQIDLLIMRDDPTVNLCEMKFTLKPYHLSSSDESSLRNRLETLANATGRKKSIQITMVTASGLDDTSHRSIVSNEVRLEDMFRNADSLKMI